MFRKLLGGVVCVALIGGLAAGPAHALLEDNLTSLTDEQTKGYLSPLVGGLSTSLNSGIFRSGNVPASGLNFTIDVRAAYIGFSDDKRVFTTPETGGFESVEASTIIGDTQSVTADHQTIAGLTFAYPGGFDMSNFGVAVPQLTIGNVLGTRAIVRYISLSLGDEDFGDLKLFGIGGQHSVSQYLPGVPVDIAVGIMYQTFDVGDGVIDSNALALNVTGSKRFGALVTVEPYVGLGMDSFEMTAEYDTGDGEKLRVEFDRQSDPHLSIGATLNLPVVKLNGELTIADQTGFAGGLSFGI